VLPAQVSYEKSKEKEKQRKTRMRDLLPRCVEEERGAEEKGGTPSERVFERAGKKEPWRGRAREGSVFVTIARTGSTRRRDFGKFRERRAAGSRRKNHTRPNRTSEVETILLERSYCLYREQNRGTQIESDEGPSEVEEEASTLWRKRCGNIRSSRGKKREAGRNSRGKDSNSEKYKITGERSANSVGLRELVKGLLKTLAAVIGNEGPLLTGQGWRRKKKVTTPIRRK